MFLGNISFNITSLTIMFFYLILLVTIFINYIFINEKNIILNPKFKRITNRLPQYKTAQNYLKFNNTSTNTHAHLNRTYVSKLISGNKVKCDVLFEPNFNKNNTLVFEKNQQHFEEVSKKTFISNVYYHFFEMIYDVILNMVKNTIGGDNRHSIKFFPIVLTLFLFVLFANILGLIPYSSTLTAYIIITLSLSIMVMFACTFYAFQMHGSDFIGFFLPSGCPGWLIPILVPIELISYIFRVVSLSVRLFANMMAGHTLLAVIAGFGWAMATGGILLFIVHPLPVFVVFVLVGLETAVALIQAYVFAILTCIYFDEAVNMH